LGLKHVETLRNKKYNTNLGNAHFVGLFYNYIKIDDAEKIIRTYNFMFIYTK